MCATSGGLPDAEYYNISGRALPDVSALSTNYEVVIQGLWGPISGTSAAAPTFAAVVTLLNDARYQAGKGPLGFLNPFLYQVPHAMKGEVSPLIGYRHWT